jgi:hypothetical protein
VKVNWQTFLFLSLIYAFLYLILVRGLSGGINLTAIKSSLNHTKGASSLSVGLSLLSDLVGNSSSGQSSGVNSGVYQTILLIIVSLAIIWALRQVYNKTKIRVRDAFYKGMYPVIQFTLVLLVIAIEFIPLLIGAALYSQVITNGIAVGVPEKIIWAIIFILLALVSLYLSTSTLFALYIVTLPDMTPFKAMRSARALVRQRRFLVLRKILFLPVIVILGVVIVMLPIIILLTPIASWIFLIIAISLLVFFHSYIYALYRELINE